MISLDLNDAVEKGASIVVAATRAGVIR